MRTERSPMPRFAVSLVFVLRAFSAMAFVGVFVFLLGAVFWREDAIIRVQARTERASIEIGDGPSPVLRFAVAHALDKTGATLAACDMIIRASPGADITLARKGTGPLYITISNMAGASPASYACAPDGPEIEGDAVDVVVVSPELTTAALFHGAVTLGSVPTEGGGVYQGILQGTVGLAAKSLVSKGVDAFQSADIGPGEQVIFRDRQGRPAPGYSTVLIDSGPGLEIVHQARAFEALVSRYGGGSPEGTLLAPNLIARLQANAEWGLIPLVVGLLFNAISLVFRKNE